MGVKPQHINITIDGTNLKHNSYFKYLGSTSDRRR